MTEVVIFDYEGEEVAYDPATKMWNLNAMHQAAGGDPNKAPYEWLRQIQTAEFLAAAIVKYGTHPNAIIPPKPEGGREGVVELRDWALEVKDLAMQAGLIETRRGCFGGGTWTHWQIAAAYAKILTPSFYLQWNEWAVNLSPNSSHEEGMEDQELVSPVPQVAALIQRTVDFYGDALVAVQTETGIYVPVKPICEILGIDWNAQYQRLMRDEVLSSTMCVIHMVGADGKLREMVCLPDHMLHGWLFGVSVERIKPENRDRLICYKRECYRVLHAAFQKQSDSVPINSARLVDLEQRITRLERHAAQCLEDVTQADYQPSERQIAVLLHLLSSRRGQRATDIIGATHISKSTMSHALGRLLDAGLVSQNDRRQYRITDVGRLCLIAVAEQAA